MQAKHTSIEIILIIHVLVIHKSVPPFNKFDECTAWKVFFFKTSGVFLKNNF